jgi:hypothetical protein
MYCWIPLPWTQLVNNLGLTEMDSIVTVACLSVLGGCMTTWRGERVVWSCYYLLVHQQWFNALILRYRHKLLDTILLGEHAQYRGYTLRIVGHSLGAGIGVILSLMLRNKFPNLRCLCYSPPGGLLTWELATSCFDFVNSFVLDSDIVPRLSLNNMERLVITYCLLQMLR